MSAPIFFLSSSLLSLDIIHPLQFFLVVVGISSHLVRGFPLSYRVLDNKTLSRWWWWWWGRYIFNDDDDSLAMILNEHGGRGFFLKGMDVTHRVPISLFFFLPFALRCFFFFDFDTQMHMSTHMHFSNSEYIQKIFFVVVLNILEGGNYHASWFFQFKFPLLWSIPFYFMISFSF